MSKKKKKESRSTRKKQREKSSASKYKEAILSLFASKPGRGLTFSQIIRKAGAKKKEDLKKVERFLESLLKGDRIRKLRNGSFVSKIEQEELIGVVDHVSSRFAYIDVGTDDDIYVKTKDLASAVDGDTVKVSLLPSRQGDKREGKVVEIIKRNRNRFVGKIQISPGFAFVVPDFRKIHQDFFIYPENINGAKTNDKVVVEVISWATSDRKPEARVVEVLGKAGENEAEIHSIMAEFDLPFRFPEEVLLESQSIPEGITKEEINKRRDFREVTTFTIDPADAKDFDDALSFRKLDNGHYEIGVHIADVTHYVTPNSKLEDEAYERA